MNFYGTIIQNLRPFWSSFDQKKLKLFIYNKSSYKGYLHTPIHCPPSEVVFVVLDEILHILQSEIFSDPFFCFEVKYP